jgi:cytoskeleton protein RodZ
VTESTSTGALLRTARRKRRVSIERAAEETRIRADFLMRMESDEFDFLAPAYVRGFLKTYTRFLGLDTTSFVGEFDRHHGSSRADTAAIVAIDRRTRRAPKQPRKRFSSWGVAAALASAVLLFLGVLGLVQGTPDEAGGPERTAQGGGQGSPGPRSESRTNSAKKASPRPSPSPSDTALALEEGIDLRVVAANDRCWMQAYVDGAETPQLILELGQSHSYHAEEDITLLLGNAQGVELVVNGRNIGSPGGIVKTIKLPDDIDSLV